MIDTSDYISMVLSLPNTDPMTVLTLFLLALMRVVPVVAMAPFLGAKLPSGVKIGLAVSLVVMVLPQLLISSRGHLLTFDVCFVGYCMKEVFVGMCIAILIAAPFYIVQSSGVLVDFLRGSSALQVQDPLMQNQSSSIGQLYNYIFIVVFYQIGGVFAFLSGLFHSYTFLPVHTFLPPSFFQLHNPFWLFVTELLAKFLALSIQFAAPSLVAILMAEMFLGIANRLAPQVQIAFLGMSLKSLIGLAILWAGWFFLLQQIGKQSLIWVDSLNHLIESFQS